MILICGNQRSVTTTAVIHRIARLVNGVAYNFIYEITVYSTRTCQYQGTIIEFLSVDNRYRPIIENLR